MNTDKKLQIASLNVRPNIFDHQFAAITAESANLSILDECHDYMFFPSNGNITVAIMFANTSACTDSPSGINRTVSVEIIDRIDQETISSQDICLKMDAKQDIHREMVTLPVRVYGDTPHHPFQIVVINKRTHHIYKSHNINLFKMPAVKKLPTKWLEPMEGCIYKCGRQKPRGQVAISVEGKTNVAVRIKLRLAHPMLHGCMPELFIRTVTNNGGEFTNYVVPQPDGEDYIVEQTFTMFNGVSGYGYTEVRCMTYLLGVIPFHMGATDIEGTITEKYIVKKTDYELPDVEKSMKAYIGDNCPEKLDIIEKFDEDDFDRLLDEFIEGAKNCTEDVNGDDDDSIGNEDFDDIMNDDDNNIFTSDNNDNDFINDGKENTQNALDQLVGLESVKNKVERYAITAQFNRRRMLAGLPETQMPMHSMFLGSPGTGKTTVAKIIGQKLHEAGVLSKGHVVVRERSTLIGQYYSSEGENTLKALEEAQGGILFIDEAYQLFQPQDPRDPGRFVIETLMTALADESNRDWMLILAGYTKPMRRMFEINPGLSSRIPESNIILFEDYGEDELMEIAHRYFDTNKYCLTEEATEKLRANIANACASRNESFGNARYVMNLIQIDIIPAMAVRLSKEASPTAEQLSIIVAEDIPLSQKHRVETTRRIGFR